LSQPPDEPQFPPIPAIGDILDRKARFIENIYSILKCESCQAKITRSFKPGDFTFKKISDEECEKCRLRKLTIEEIYSEWVDPRKKKKK